MSGLDEIGKQKELFVTWTKLKGLLWPWMPPFFFGGGVLCDDKGAGRFEVFFVFAGRGGRGGTSNE